MNRLAELLSSRVRAAILELLFGAESEELHMRELARQSGFHEATVRQELSKLRRLKLVCERREGNRAYYCANPVSPVHGVIRTLIAAETAAPATLRRAWAAYPTGRLGSLSAVREAAARYADVRRRVLIIAGPNGAGKTTFAHEFLLREAQCPVFVNADYLAAGLSPLFPADGALKAGRLMVREMVEHVGAGHSFAFETTLSGQRYARAIPQWQERGYGVKLVFLRLASPDLAVQRVAARVRQGGHDVAEPLIRRRFEAGWRNWLEIYRPLVDAWAVYDSSGSRPVLAEEGERS